MVNSMEKEYWNTPAAMFTKELLNRIKSKEEEY